MARGEEKDLKALWEVTEELWGVEGEMVFQNLSQSFSQTSKFFSIFHNLSKLPFKTCSVFTLSKLFFILSRLFHPFQPFLDLSKRRWNDLAKVEVRQGRGGLEVSSGEKQFFSTGWVVFSFLAMPSFPPLCPGGFEKQR